MIKEEKVTYSCDECGKVIVTTGGSTGRVVSNK